MNRISQKETTILAVLVFIIVCGLCSCTKTVSEPVSKKPAPHVVDSIPVVLVDTPKRNDAVIYCLGNSLTVGYRVADTSMAYPSQLRRLLDTMRVFNLGVNGFTTTQLIEKGAPSKTAGARNIAVVWEIGNDIFYHGMTAMKAYENFVQYCRTVRDSGFKVVVVTNPYRNNYYMGYPTTLGGDDSTAYRVKLDSTNVLLRAHWQDFADQIADISIDAHFQEYDEKYYQADHSHLTADSYAIVSETIYQSILKLK